MSQTDAETRRLAVVDELLSNDWIEFAELERLTHVAAYICGAPTQASISLVDDERQRQLFTSYGALNTAPRETALCEPAIESGAVHYLVDASVDRRFAANPYVDGRLGDIRFYLSVPLVVADHPVGSLCAFAPVAVELGPEQLARLEDLAVAASTYFEMGRRVASLQRQMVLDPLTGVCNRNLLDDALARFIARGERGFTRPGVLFADLNRFKAINDTYGHDVGDDVLRETARRLVGTVRAADLVIRMGGDEFVVLVDEAPEPEQARVGMAQLAERVRERLAEPFHLADGRGLDLSAAVGWALHEQGTEVDLDLLRRADLAMYADKALISAR